MRVGRALVGAAWRGKAVSRQRALVVVGATGGAFLVAVAAGIPTDDAVQLVALSFGGALTAYVLGTLALRSLGSSAAGTLRTGPLVVALIPLLSLMVGTVAAARAMFVSTHDLSALMVVIVGSSGAGVLGALALARELDAARRLAAEAEHRERMIEKSRCELIAWISHDLRTPLAGIRAMSEALEDGVVSDDDAVRGYYGALIREADRLARLVDDLFELSRAQAMQANILRLTKERVSLSELVADAMAAAVFVAESKGIDLRSDIDDRGGQVLVSNREMVRVVHNLLDNAMRHTPVGGLVSIDVGCLDGHGVISVRDQCGGIGDHDIDRVFDLAYRGDPARSPVDDGGGGLGLAIARGFVEAHEGDICVQNEGDGCRFVVRVPLADQPSS